MKSIGISGFNRLAQYPRRERLTRYAEQASFIEVSYTQSAIPTTGMIQKWGSQVPDGFVFTFRAPKAITPINILAGDTSFNMFMRRLSSLGDKLGPVSMVIDKAGKYEKGMMAQLLGAMPDHVYAFEIVSPSWDNEDVISEIANRGHTVVRTSMKSDPGLFSWDFYRLALKSLDIEEFKDNMNGASTKPKKLVLEIGNKPLPKNIIDLLQQLTKGKSYVNPTSGSGKGDPNGASPGHYGVPTDSMNDISFGEHIVNDVKTPRNDEAVKPHMKDDQLTPGTMTYPDTEKTGPGSDMDTITKPNHGKSVVKNKSRSRY